MQRAYVSTLLHYRILGGICIYLMNFIYYLSFNRQHLFLLQLILPGKLFINQSFSQYELLSLSSSPFLVTSLSIWFFKRRTQWRRLLLVQKRGLDISSHPFLYITQPVWFAKEKSARPRCWETMTPYFNYKEKSASCICYNVLSWWWFVNAIPYLSLTNHTILAQTNAVLCMLPQIPRHN